MNEKLIMIHQNFKKNRGHDSTHNIDDLNQYFFYEVDSSHKCFRCPRTNFNRVIQIIILNQHIHLVDWNHPLT